MAYADYSRYTSIYGEGSISEIDFNRFSYDASRYMDYCTTGVDGVKKLKIAHPTDADDAEAVIRCACALIHDMSEIDAAEKRAASVRGLVQREDGTVTGAVVSSVSSGSESISYSVSSGQSAIDAAVASEDEHRKLYFATVRKYLSGVKDANGVNLLYGGAYPYVL